MSSIVIPYIREHTIDDGATVKNGEAVFKAPFFSSGDPGLQDSSGDRVRESRGRGHGASDRVAGPRTGPKLGGPRGPDRRGSPAIGPQS